MANRGLNRIIRYRLMLTKQLVSMDYPAIFPNTRKNALGYESSDMWDFYSKWNRIELSVAHRSSKDKEDWIAVILAQ
jgi:hypothetical protein